MREIERNIHTDLIIVGGGGAGLAAAVMAKENGIKNIIIVEKRSVLGGNSIFPFGLLATETNLLKRSGFETSSDDIYQRMMSYTHWKTDPRLIRTLINRTTDNIKWLEEKGVHFTKLGSLYNNQIPITAHCIEGNKSAGTVIIKLLAAELQHNHVQIMSKTTANKILVDSRGSVAGIIVSTSNGDLKISAKCIILSTGGFAGNPELIKKFDSSYDEKEFVQGGIPNKGDATTMVEEIGAAIEGMVLEMDGQEFKWSKCLSVVARRPNTIWVNTDGERFVNESLRSVNEIANTIYRQPGRISYTLFDENIKSKICEEELSPMESLFLKSKPVRLNIERELKDQAAKGHLKISNTWDDIARWISAPLRNLKATVNEYNSSCNSKYDGAFLKEPRFLKPLCRPPYYALRCGIRILVTHGGPRINHRMEVLNHSLKTIPGLYAAGTEIGGAEWGTYNIFASGHSFAFTISSGRIAGEEAAKYIKSTE